MNRVPRTQAAHGHGIFRKHPSKFDLHLWHVLGVSGLAVAEVVAVQRERAYKKIAKTLRAVPKRPIQAQKQNILSRFVRKLTGRDNKTPNR